MAILSKIRQRSLLAAIVIGFCLFAFIIGDLVNSNLFSQSSQNIGSINGTDIPFEAFRIKVDNLEKSGQNTTQAQAVNQVWNQEVSIALLTAEFEKLGLNAGKKQIIEILKQTQDIGQNPMFQNEAKEFDLAKFQEFMKTATPEQRALLGDREKDATLNAKFQAYSTMIKAGVYTTAAEGKLKYEMETNKANFDYVSVPYSSVKDSEIKILDDEILKYMNENKKKYKSDANNEIEYVLVENKPSTADEDAVKNDINTALAGGIKYNQETKTNDTIVAFAVNNNNAEFVNSNSDIPFDSTFVAKKDLPNEHADKLFNLAVGGIYGPYQYNGYYAVSKLLGRQAGANAKASHVLIAYKGAMRAAPTVTRTKEEAALQAQDILAQAQANPSSFMMLAFTNSDDSSKQQGGDLGYFSKGQMTKKFNDFVFGNPVGKIGLVETEFGYHIINITDKQDAVKLATIARKIEASEETSDKNYTKATQLELDANKNPLATVAKKAGLVVVSGIKLKGMDEVVGSLGNQRAIVQWAFGDKTKIGDIRRFDINNIGHVIVKLKSKNPEGIMAVSDARPMLEQVLKNKKKFQKLAAKMKGGSLEAIAKANAVTVQTITDLTVEGAVFPNIGQEQKVVATAFAIGNKISAPIEGNTGVFVVKTKNVVKAPALKVYTDYISKLKQQNASAANRVVGALKEDAKIDDKRQLFF
jgi:peptidyl-prolyl cis-trans isomerase D